MADFIDKLKSGLTKGVATVSTGSKNVIEKTRHTAGIKGLENEIKDLSTQIGTRLYNWCATNPEGDIPRAEYDDLCREIAIRNEQIKQHKLRIEELDEEISQVIASASPCSCGQSNPAGTKFCAGCGKPLN